MKNRAIFLLVCILLFTGCSNGYTAYTNQWENEEYSTYNQEQPFDPAQLFVKMVERGECNCFYLYYRNPDGSETQIVWMGLQTGIEQEHPFFIISERIFFTQAGQLVSVAFNGENINFLFGDTEEEISFDWIDFVDGEWLYISGTKWQEIYDDPSMLGEFRRVPIRTRVSADFSEIVVLADISKRPFGGTALYEAILAEVNTPNENIAIKSARVIVETDGSFSQIMLNILVYRNVANSSDRWSEGSVWAFSQPGTDWHVEFMESTEQSALAFENSVANYRMLTPVEYVTYLEIIYNSNFIEYSAIGTPINHWILHNIEEYLTYASQDESTVEWFSFRNGVTEKAIKPGEISPTRHNLIAQDYFIIVSLYWKNAVPEDRIIFEYGYEEGAFVTANVRAVFFTH